jgi:hypothetical protein
MRAEGNFRRTECIYGVEGGEGLVGVYLAPNHVTDRNRGQLFKCQPYFQ